MHINIFWYIYLSVYIYMYIYIFIFKFHFFCLSQDETLETLVSEKFDWLRPTCFSILRWLYSERTKFLWRNISVSDARDTSDSEGHAINKELSRRNNNDKIFSNALAVSYMERQDAYGCCKPNDRCPHPF